MSTQRYGRSQKCDWNALTNDEFAALVRADLERHYPENLRHAPRLPWDQQTPWTDHLIERNWLAPGWPVDVGGMGLSPIKQIVFSEEHERWGATEYRDHGVTQIGPLLLSHGTLEQRDRWLPPILRAEHHWAQGYSEPEAGSDLASLRTRAVSDGDVYVVDGQKIWTTMAGHATHIYFLARTDPSVKKQAGISFLLADITAPGITVRPIVDIAGHTELYEVFFEAVRVPVADRIGAENGGWTVAKSLLGHERIRIGSPAAAMYGLSVLDDVAASQGLGDDARFHERRDALRLEVEHLRDAYARYKAMLQRGEEIGPDVSMLKIVATETATAIADLILEAAGEAGAHSGNVQLDDGRWVDLSGPFYKARPATIYGGSNEIQRNIIATAVLNLPRS